MPAVALPNLTGLRLLVVDDSYEDLDLLQILFTKCGATVKAARDVDTAMAYVDTAPTVDALISDLAMPGRDGIDLIRQLRRHPRRGALPAIALSGFHDRQASAKQAGYDAFFRKPVDFDTVCHTLRDVIAAKRPMLNAG